MAIAMTTGYSAQTEGAQLCIEAASDWALTCVDHLDDQSNHVLIDYGAADGGTAVSLWTRLLDRLHARHPKAHLTLIGNDLPSNDNAALASNLALQIPGQAAPTVLISARSFYEPTVAPETVSFGFSATAMHWLSQSPGPQRLDPDPCAAQSRAEGGRTAADGESLPRQQGPLPRQQRR